MSTIEIVESAQLQTALAKSGLSNPELVEIRDAFHPLFAKAEQIVKAAESIVVVDATHVSEMKAARTARLDLKAIRVESEKVRKGLKESALRRGQVIDDAGRMIRAFIEPVEERLLAMEETAERAEAARKEALRVDRSGKVVAAGGDPQFYQLGEMPEPAFVAMLAGLVAAQQAAKDAAEKAEADRIAKEQAEREARAKLEADKKKAEEERQAALAELKKANEAREASERKAAAEREAAEKKARDDAAAAKRKADTERAAVEAKAKAEREAAEAVARKEREAREKAEAELAAKKRAEEKAVADAEKARKAAERAPDIDKIRAVATAVRALTMPDVKSAESRAAVAELADARERFAKWIETRAAALTAN